MPPLRHADAAFRIVAGHIPGIYRGVLRARMRDNLGAAPSIGQNVPAAVHGLAPGGFPDTGVDTPCAGPLLLLQLLARKCAGLLLS